MFLCPWLFFSLRCHCNRSTVSFFFFFFIIILVCIPPPLFLFFLFSSPAFQCRLLPLFLLLLFPQCLCLLLIIPTSSSSFSSFSSRPYPVSPLLIKIPHARPDLPRPITTPAMPFRSPTGHLPRVPATLLRLPHVPFSSPSRPLNTLYTLLACPLNAGHAPRCHLTSLFYFLVIVTLLSVCLLVFFLPLLTLSFTSFYVIIILLLPLLALLLPLVFLSRFLVFFFLSLLVLLFPPVSLSPFSPFLYSSFSFLSSPFRFSNASSSSSPPLVPFFPSFLSSPFYSLL